jgi:hypothetical protein
MWYFIAAAPMTYDPEESLAVLSRTIAAHAKQLADDEWRNEHAQILSDILAIPASPTPFQSMAGKSRSNR